MWRHKSGHKSLLIGATAYYVEGMSFEEGRALLCRLQEFATQPQYVYRHEWSVGDLLVWDNAGTMHKAAPYDLNSKRLMDCRTGERGRSISQALCAPNANTNRPFQVFAAAA